MKVAVLSNVLNIDQIVDKVEHIEEVVKINSLEELQSKIKFDGLVIDRLGMQATELLSLRENHPNICIIMFFQEKDDLFEKTCITHEIYPMLEEDIELRLYNVISERWFNVTKNTDYENVIAIAGTHSRVGVTEIALGLGVNTVNFNRKTILISLNPYSPGELEKIQTKQSFEHIYELFENNYIPSIDEFLNQINEVQGLYYLVGNRDFYKAYSFKREPIEKLINFAKENFDIVYLDVGSFFENFAPNVGLLMSNTHLWITTQEHVGIKQYKRWEEQIFRSFEFKAKHKHLVINQYSNQALLNPKYMEENLGIPFLRSVPFIPGANDIQIETSFIANSDERRFIDPVHNLTKALLNEVDENEKPLKKKFSLFSSKGR